MNGDAPGPAERSPFFRRFLTKCRKAAQGLAIVAVVSGLAAAGRWEVARVVEAHKPTSESPPPVSVAVVPLREEVVEAGTSYSAVVKEARKVDLSFRVAGTLEYLCQVEGPGGKLRNVHEGDRFPEGMVLARLDPSDYRRDRGVAAERLAGAEARLSQAESDKDLARIDHRRTEQLVKRGSATASELDSARAKLRNTTAAADAASREIASARISLEQAEANLSYCTLAVPFPEGTVAARSVENYERVAANQRAFQVLDLATVSIAFSVPDALVGRLETGRTVEVTTDALPDARYAGVIHKIGSTADPQTRTYAVEVRVDRPGGLKPGMVASVHFRREARAHLLPLTSVVPGPDGSGYAVYRVVDEGDHVVVRRLAVEFDDVMDNRVAVRLDPGRGLKPGDRVVANGVHRLNDGQTVRVAE